jgi:hypothetical protein
LAGRLLGTLGIAYTKTPSAAAARRRPRCLGQRPGPGLQGPPDRPRPGPSDDRPPPGGPALGRQAGGDAGPGRVDNRHRLARGGGVPRHPRPRPGGLARDARCGQEAGDHAQGEARPGADPPDVRPGAAPGRGRALDLADVDLEAGTVAVVGKGKSERMPVSTSPAIPTPAPPTSTTAPSRRSAARSSIRSRTDRAAARHPDVVW